MSEKVNVLEILNHQVSNAALEIVRLDANQTALLPFSMEGEKAAVHYCAEPELSGYVACNGADCILCRAGKKKEERYLLPAYLPTTGCVGVLQVSTSMRPGGLLPQLGAVFRSDQRMAVFISREGPKFTVTTSPLAEDADAGEAAIKKLMEEYDAGQVHLVDALQHIANEELARVESLAKILKMKGLQ